MSIKPRIPFYNPIDPTHPKVWPDYKLLMPVCAVGNVGQLACDLIISTLLSKNECQLIGRIYSPALMPVVGPNAFSPQGPPTTSTEIYESKTHKLIIIQQRTSYFKNLKHTYIEELIRWIKESKFDQLLVLTSSFAQCNPDISQLGDLNMMPIRTITTNVFEKTDAWLGLNLKPLPAKNRLNVVKDGLSYLPGSGLTKSLIKACERASIPAAFLVDFCSEGINLHDCYQVVFVLDKYLNLSCRQTAQVQTTQSRGLSATATDLKAALQDIERGLDGGDGAEMAKRSWVEPYSWTQAQC
uniref:Proteasome assembly chaperone 2 n=1 Tax=Aceria tosichella TaxID=561515 RepID=A0A6G1SGD3_9ACAR